MAKILITGASGTIGSELVPYLVGKGHDAEAYKRSAPCSLEGFDVVINLAGSPVVEGRWSSARKEKILSSRVETTKQLVDAMRACKKPPSLLISASATGFYGNKGDAVLTETAPQGTGFLADVCSKWEHEASLASLLGVRVIALRIGIVLTPKGGALKKMLPAFRLGLGATLGSGQQWMSWISMADLIATVEHCIATPSLSGPVNAVAPNPVTNKQFTKTLAKALHRPAWFTAPAWLLRLVLGELAEETILSSTRVMPEKLLRSGFAFANDVLTKAL